MDVSIHLLFSIIYKTISQEEQYIQDLDTVETVGRTYYLRSATDRLLVIY